MTRRLFNITVALSAALCVAAAALWVRSYRVHDNLSAGFGGPTYQLTSGGGQFVLARSKPGLPAYPRLPRGVRWTVEPPFRWDDVYGNPMYASHRVPLLGLAYVTTPTAAGVHAPHWLACLVFGALPAAWAVRRARRPVPPGVCRSCGYDLTGNVSGVCPECGQPAAQ